MSRLTAAILLAASSAVAHAADAEKGRTYDITIAQEVKRPFIGKLSETSIGATAVQIEGAKVGERYTVVVSDVRKNRFTGKMQAACTYRQTGGDRTGKCNMPPF